MEPFWTTQAASEAFLEKCIWVSGGGSVCCDQCLPETQTAVARGNPGMSEYVKTLEFKFANQRIEHKHIVECPAAQADPIDRRFVSKQAREARESFD